MSKLLIKHADILTLDAEDRVLRNSTLAIQDKTIVGVGSIPSGFYPDATIDGAHHVALPCFFKRMF